MKPQSVLDSTIVPTLHCFHINKGRLTTQLDVMHVFDLVKNGVVSLDMP